MSFTFESGTPINNAKNNFTAFNNKETNPPLANGTAFNGMSAFGHGGNQQNTPSKSNYGLEKLRPKRKPNETSNDRSGNMYIHSGYGSKDTISISNNGNGSSLQRIDNQSSQSQTYSQEEVSSTGPLFSNPRAFGFQQLKKSIKPRPTPKYFLTQPKYLDTPPFVQNEWDKQNQIKMEQMESANQGKDYQGLYEDLQKLREVERKEMETLGLVDAENTAKNLNEAIAFQGSCLDMCPVFERVRRQLENNVNTLERDPSTNKITKAKAVKAFSRPAAGQPPPLPSEVRPPHVLKITLNYLVDHVVNKLPESHSFLWDRTRSIRQDFTYQNSFGPEAVDCNERIVRIHLLSLHIMAGSDVEFSQQQELEQFNKALQTLMEIYQDVRNNGGSSPNEAEFRAYHLLSHIRDPELERQIQNLPDHIYQDGRVQLALNLRKIISQNNIVERGVKNLIGALDLYVEFFRIVYSDATPLLMACLLETHFSEIRFYALKAMSRTFHTRGKPYQMDTLRNLLGFDSSEKLIKFLKYYEIDIVIENGETLVDLFNKEKLEKQYKLNSFYDKPKYPPIHSSQLNRKLKGNDLKSIINSGTPNVSFYLKSNNDVITPTRKLTSNPVATSFQPSPTTFAAITPVGDSFKPSEPKFSPPQSQSRTISHSKTANFSQAKPTAITSGSNITSTGPAFQFGPSSNTNKAAKTTKPEPTIANNDITTKPKIDFSFSKPFGTPQPAPLVQNADTNKLKAESKPLFSVQDAKPLPQKIFSQPSAHAKESQVTVKSPDKLINHHLFEKALNGIIHDVVTNLVDSETKSILTNILHRHNVKVQRLNIIKTLEDELFSAFVAEGTYQSTLEAAAEYMNNIIVQKHAIRQLTRRAAKGVLSYRSRQAKRRELQSVSVGSSLKRKSSNDLLSSTSASKKPRSDPSMTDFVNKQKEMKQLWEPLDLKNFADTCASKVSLDIKEENVKLKWLLVVENWENEYSKWLIAKFGLKPNMDIMVYENHIESDKVDLDITSLPRKEYVTKNFLRDCSFLLFECGLCIDSGERIKDKLTKDAKVLKKIISMCERFANYKPSVLVLFWDATQSGISSDEAVKYLGLQDYATTKSLKNLIFCDMANEHDSISRVLTSSFNKIGNDFDSELSPRGVKQAIKAREKQRMKQEDELIKKAQEDLARNNDIVEKDNSLMENARKLRKYDYLNRSINFHHTSKYADNPTNTNDIANRSLAQIIARRGSRHNLSSVSGNSTFLNTSMMSNNSILGGFGRGVVEESTPNTSPKRKPAIIDETELAAGSDEDDKLRKLRRLTASVRNKYHKTEKGNA
ncbi:SAC3 [Candida margitis]|uniref:SAC3 n=1 Tax=Candida margitis TaxID=1775924 RepID=UPI00222704EB|nr:SAC3 [Candida margitis]KAI5954093.1 SAC3 [Candida margitis]